MKVSSAVRPLKKPSQASFGSSENGSPGSLPKYLRIASRAVRRYAEPCLSAAPIKVSFSAEVFASLMSLAGSNSSTVLNPWHLLHAPYAELNENERGSRGGTFMPQFTQAIRSE